MLHFARVDRDGRSRFLCSNRIARPVSLHRCGVVHQTCLRSVGTMMILFGLPLGEREADRLTQEDGHRGPLSPSGIPA